MYSRAFFRLCQAILWNEIVSFTSYGSLLLCIRLPWINQHIKYSCQDFPKEEKLAKVLASRTSRSLFPPSACVFEVEIFFISFQFLFKACGFSEIIRIQVNNKTKIRSKHFTPNVYIFISSMKYCEVLWKKVKINESIISTITQQLQHKTKSLSGDEKLYSVKNSYFWWLCLPRTDDVANAQICKTPDKIRVGKDQWLEMISISRSNVYILGLFEFWQLQLHNFYVLKNICYQVNLFTWCQKWDWLLL